MTRRQSGIFSTSGIFRRPESVRRRSGGPRPMVTPAVLVVATSLLTASAVFAVWAHATALRLGYELSAMDREQKQLVRDNMRLRSEVATLKSPARLEEQARSVFGLAPPAPEQIVRVGGRRGTP